MKPTHPVHEAYFLELTAPFLKVDSNRESVSLELFGDDSTFIRYNRARVRQAGGVQDATLKLSLQSRSDSASEQIREASGSISLCGDLGTDRLAIRAALEQLRQWLHQSSPKPYATWISGTGECSSRIHSDPTLSDGTEWSERILPVVSDLDFTGILTSGRVFRAARNSLGVSHWFESESATLDYSLISSGGRAVKSEFVITGDFARSFPERIARERQILAVLEKPERRITPGDIRCYLGPASVHDLIQMFSWGCISEDAIRQGTSAFKHLRASDGRDSHALSPLFSLEEDFEANSVPRFNGRGELAPARLELITRGRLENTWVSAETAKEYGIPSNGATASEALRAPRVAGGSLPESQALKALDTGIYLPNLHYLNWSDQAGGRITGMTRHACVWVENGTPVAPIENLRWDDTLFRIFGSELEALTAELTSIPDTGSYESRSIGSTLVPGALLRSFRFVS